LIHTLLQGIAELDKKIAEAGEVHPDFFIFDSLPGAGEVMAPRLLAALGSQRDRYGSAAEVQRYSGIAPITERSGKKKWVHLRWACPKSKFSRMGGALNYEIDVGSRILPATARAWQRSPRRCAGLGFQVDSHHLPLLERSSGL